MWIFRVTRIDERQATQIERGPAARRDRLGVLTARAQPDRGTVLHPWRVIHRRNGSPDFFLWFRGDLRLRLLSTFAGAPVAVGPRPQFLNQQVDTRETLLGVVTIGRHDRKHRS